MIWYTLSIIIIRIALQYFTHRQNEQKQKPHGPIFLDQLKKFIIKKKFRDY